MSGHEHVEGVLQQRAICTWTGPRDDWRTETERGHVGIEGCEQGGWVVVMGGSKMESI